MSPIIEFYAGRGVDARGRTLAEIQGFDNARMESTHDFIQWAFPLRQASHFNPDAPVLGDDDVHAFRDRPELRANLRRSFAVFLGFLGLEIVEGVVREAHGAHRRAAVFARPNHNWLRITRVLLCLQTLGLKPEARAFYLYLEGVNARGGGVTRDTFEYWRSASEGVAL